MSEFCEQSVIENDLGPTTPQRAITAHEEAPQAIITVNGPGEIAGWLRPLVYRLKQDYPRVRICVALMPCAFVSGAELDQVRSMPEVDAVCSVRETLALVFLGMLPKGFRTRCKGFVLHLGGETALTWLLGKRMRQPCLAYVERPFPLKDRFDRVFYSGLEGISAAELGGNSILLGDLIVDAAWMKCPDRASYDRSSTAIVLFPGSRDYIVKFTLPFLAKVADLVSQERPEVNWLLAMSNHLPSAYLRNLPDINDGRKLEGENLRWAEDREGNAALITKAGTNISVMPQNEVWPRATLAVTIPGTVTAELAALGIPLVLILPTVHAETAPLPGIAGYLELIPWVGRYIKSRVALRYLKRFKLTAHPNRRAKRMIVPELVGRITARQVADQILSILNSDIGPIERELKNVMGQPNAAQRLVEGLRPYLEPQP